MMIDGFDLLVILRTCMYFAFHAISGHPIDSLQVHTSIIQNIYQIAKRKEKKKKTNIPQKHLQPQNITMSHFAQDHSTSSAASSPPASYVYL